MSTWGRITKETLTAIANAIRAKTGKSTLIEPVDMPAEIASIPQKELPPAPVMMNAHNFFDYDGTLLFSYSAAEVAEMTELPTPAVSHDGLIFDGWNWTLEEIQTAPFSVVGAHYRTDDGATRLYIKLPIGNTEVKFGLIAYNTSNTPNITVNWGDGTESTKTLKTSSADVMLHTYSAAGYYKISVYTDVYGAWFSRQAYFDGDTNLYSTRLKPAIYRIESGEVEISGSMFEGCTSLNYVTTRKDVVKSSTINAVNAPLKFITIPKNAIVVKLERTNSTLFSIPPLTGSLNSSSTAMNNMGLLLGVIGCSVTAIPNGFLSNSGIITNLSSHYPTRIVLLSDTPPALSSSSYMGVNKVAIYVPDDSVDTYKSATNWSDRKIYSISTLIAELTGGES